MASGVDMYSWIKKRPDKEGRGKEMIKTRLSYQVLEDNGGGLHLVVFDDDECIYYVSELEHLPAAVVQEMLQSLQDGTDPVQDGWEANCPEDYTPQEMYDKLTSYEYGWEIIADESDTYPWRMGAAGKRAFGLDD